MANLVFTSAGDHHNVAQWSGGERNFEICVCYYGQTEFRNPHPVEMVRNEFKGSKFQNLKALHESDRDYLNRFSSIFVVDDDIEITAAQIDELFVIREELDLDIVQPAQSGHGRVSYPSLMPFDGALGRLTNFCEVCVPLFRADLLVSFLDEYDGSLVGWGIDWWYSHRARPDKIAVIDRVLCRNPHESDKGLAIREIDRCQDPGSRRLNWERKRAELGLSPAQGYHENVVVTGELVDPANRVEAVTDGSRPRVSVIVEWENIVLADSQNVPRLFSALLREVHELGEQVEVNIMLDPAVIDRSQLSGLLSLSRLADSDLIDVRLHEVSDRHYYELKNEGVLRSTAEIVVFADSDIEPAPGWLVSLVRYLQENDDIGLVGGYTYIKPEGLVATAFSAGWFFPLEPVSSDLENRPAKFLWSNNCAYRRNVYLAHPYRATSFNETRGACGRQLVEMKASGVGTANVSSAVVTHPAPNGLRHFMTRALAEGRDRTVDVKIANPRANKLSCLRTVFRIARGKVRQTLRNSIWERSRLNSTLGQAPILVLTMGCYYSILMAGALFTVVRPDWVEGRWQI